MSTSAAISGIPRARLEPARLGVWLFLVSEAMLFAGLLAAFVVLRTGSATFGGPGDALSLATGAAATAVLVLSSICLARATSASVRAEGRGRAATWILIALLLGLVFLAVQALEWRHLIASGVHVRTNLFWSSFFVLTGVHGLHVAGGLAWNAVAWRRARATDSGAPSARASDDLFVDLAATYWHFVDAVWLVLFALLYVSN